MHEQQLRNLHLLFRVAEIVLLWRKVTAKTFARVAVLCTCYCPLEVTTDDPGRQWLEHDVKLLGCMGALSSRVLVNRLCHE